MRKPIDLFADEPTATSTDFAQMFERSLSRVGAKVEVGDKVRGEVLSIGKEQVFVSTGTIDDGIVLNIEFADHPNFAAIKVGDFLDLYVVRVSGGQIYLSPNPTAKNLSEDLEDAFDMMLPVEGRVSEVVNGGFRVAVLGKTAFCPLSQIDLRRGIDSASYVGQKLTFMITQFDPKGRNIVVSRRKLLEEQKAASQAAFGDEYKTGDSIQGKVTRLEKFGAFVEIADGVEGLCHISELAWSRVENPGDVMRVGEVHSFKILKIEQGLNDRLNVSLSLKQASAAPWDNLPQQIQSGVVVSGRVTKLMKFGAFVEVAPGIEGLLPLSEMSEVKRITRCEELLRPGQVINVMIKEVRQSEQKLLLSLKDAAQQVDNQAQQAELSAVQAKQNRQSLGTLADQFKDVFGKRE